VIGVEEGRWCCAMTRGSRVRSAMCEGGAWPGDSEA
jgi:hypothetical protein